MSWFATGDFVLRGKSGTLVEVDASGQLKVVMATPAPPPSTTKWRVEAVDAAANNTGANTILSVSGGQLVNNKTYVIQRLLWGGRIYAEGLELVVMWDPPGNTTLTNDAAVPATATQVSRLYTNGMSVVDNVNFSFATTATVNRLYIRRRVIALGTGGRLTSFALEGYYS
jgi:hypothetical protein